MEKDIKEQLEKLQYYGEFYAKSDIDDKIKLEELDKTGEISEKTKKKKLKYLLLILNQLVHQLIT